MCTGYGLIAGVTLDETLASTPGFVMDMFLMKRAYDDEQHGLKRRKTAAWGDDD